MTRSINIAALIISSILLFSFSIWLSSKRQELVGDFFGGRVISKYYAHFDDNLVCAKVSGWHLETQCLCFLELSQHPGNDRTLLYAQDHFCQDEGY